MMNTFLSHPDYSYSKKLRFLQFPYVMVFFNITHITLTHDDEVLLQKFKRDRII